MRSGVRARLASRSRNVQSPSVLVMKLIGLAVRSSRQAHQPSAASGARHTTQTPTFSAIRPRRLTRSIELSEIHARVERRDLIAVAVEHERVAAAELADASLGGLAP